MDAIAQLNTALTGRYEIDREIGAGGMATVYLARDLKHDRKVALKVLNPELGAILGVERFLAEIKVTANLQHPNLLPLFDSGAAEGLLFYVMPYVEGESLRARLSREKQLPVEESIRIAVSVAGALDYAHGHGVIHRDLKPENILIQAGQPVLADFGIALAVAKAGGARVTQTGLSLGTPQYMSPEQATGDRAIDGRTDIYSLGAVLYEMLVGDPPYTGSTAQAIIAKVLTDKPRAVRLARASVSAHIEAAVERALEKLPADRFATAREFAEALQGRGPALAASAAAQLLPAHVLPAHGSAPSTRRRSRALGAAPWTIAAIAVAAWAWGALGRPASSAPRARFAFVLGDSARLRSEVPGGLIALSPDGSQLAYVGGSTVPRLLLRTLDDLTPKPLPGTENAANLQFSPDGKWIAFVQGSRIKKLPLAGGPVATITDDAVSFSWGEDDVVIFSRLAGPNAGLWRVSAAGGTAQRLTHLDTTRRELAHYWPEVLPGAKAVLFEARMTTFETDQLAVVTLNDGKMTRLGVQGSNPRYVPTGHILFGRSDGSVYALPFDARSLRVTGPAVPVLEDVMVRNGATLGGAVEIAVSTNGTLVYAQGKTDGQLVMVDRQGRFRALRADLQRYAEPRFSPDGRRLAMTIQGTSGTPDVWVEDLAARTLTRLTNDGRSDRPSWTPDGRRIAWRARRDSTGYGISWKPSDGSGAAELLIQDGYSALFAGNGKFFVTNTVRPTTGADIDLVALDSGRTRTQFVNSPAAEQSPRISPDGRWLAFMSNQSSKYEVYVRAISGPEGVHQISTDGASEPAWAPDGRELFYRAGAKIVSATIATTPDFAVVRRDALFDDAFQVSGNYTNYDVTRDGKEFVMVKSLGAQEPPVVVFGWLDELRQRMKLAAKK
jgi:serine/threonine-protein kinase